MDRFAQTLQAAQGYQAPSDNPLGASYGGLLHNAMASKFKLGATSTPLNAFSADQANKAEEAAAAAELARKQKISDLQDKAQLIKDAQEGKNYKQIQKPDGGYDYFDPLGNKISLQSYAQVVGKNPADILKKSSNNLDIQYVNDYSNLKDLLQNYNNPKYMDKLKKDNPNEWKAIQGLTPEQLTQQFVKSYPNVYQEQNINASPRGGVRGQGQQLYSPPPQPGILDQIKHKVGGALGGFLHTLGI